MAFSALCTAEGARFIRDCQASGKRVMVWTVNAPAQMIEATRWGVDVILTDVTRTWLDLRAELATDFDKTAAVHGSRTFLWTTWTCYTPVQMVFWQLQRMRLESVAGPLDVLLEETNPVPIAVASGS